MQITNYRNREMLDQNSYKSRLKWILKANLSFLACKYFNFIEATHYELYQYSIHVFLWVCCIQFFFSTRQLSVNYQKSTKNIQVIRLELSLEDFISMVHFTQTKTHTQNVFGSLIHLQWKFLSIWWYKKNFNINWM